MVISDDPNYVQLLKDISVNILENQTHYLLMGKDASIQFWVKGINEFLPSPMGPKSTTIVTNDLDAIIVKIFGVDFE